MLVSKISKALTANNGKKQTNYKGKVSSVKLYIVMHCLNEQKLNRELTNKFVIIPDWQRTNSSVMGNLDCKISVTNLKVVTNLKYG